MNSFMNILYPHHFMKDRIQHTHIYICPVYRRKKDEMMVVI